MTNNSILYIGLTFSYATGMAQLGEHEIPVQPPSQYKRDSERVKAKLFEVIMQHAKDGIKYSELTKQCNWDKKVIASNIANIRPQLKAVNILGDDITANSLLLVDTFSVVGTRSKNDDALIRINTALLEAFRDQATDLGGIRTKPSGIIRLDKDGQIIDEKDKKRAQGFDTLTTGTRVTLPSMPKLSIDE